VTQKKLNKHLPSPSCYRFRNSSPLNKQYYTETHIIFLLRFTPDCEALAPEFRDILIPFPQGYSVILLSGELRIRRGSLASCLSMSLRFPQSALIVAQTARLCFVLCSAREIITGFSSFNFEHISICNALILHRTCRKKLGTAQL
jgi:hypothetical protein